MVLVMVERVKGLGFQTNLSDLRFMRNLVQDSGYRDTLGSNRTPNYKWQTLMLVQTDFEKILGLCLM